MMKTYLKRMVPLAGLLAIGCLPVSLEPLYTAKDLVVDNTLVGTWAGEDEKERWTFESAEEQAYVLRHTDSEGKNAVFKAHLLKLKGERFLDLYPDDLEVELNWLAACQLVPGHVFFKVQLSEKELRIAPMDLDWLGDYLEEHPKAIGHKRFDDGDRILLTASTADLQKFVLKHVKNPKAFDPESVLVLRRRSSQ